MRPRLLDDALQNLNNSVGTFQGQSGPFIRGLNGARLRVKVLKRGAIQGSLNLDHERADATTKNEQERNGVTPTVSSSQNGP
jgi:hypothetical protein